MKSLRIECGNFFQRRADGDKTVKGGFDFLDFLQFNFFLFECFAPSEEIRDNIVANNTAEAVGNPGYILKGVRLASYG